MEEGGQDFQVKRAPALNLDSAKLARDVFITITTKSEYLVI